ncbi:MAG TPA: glycoside hydrolase family 2 TIM barrel-domain containing protein [Opitutaceae bacterium]|nr:glycoside hydrolase family 2 TIM barrel-domain containing protein [Opitutaceae bacterium]
MNLQGLGTLTVSLLLGTSGLARAASPADIQKSWVFTTRDSLTIDLRLAPSLQPDWTRSTVSLSPADRTAAVQHLALAPADIRPIAEDGVIRITLPGLHVSAWEPTAPALYRMSLDLALADGRHATLEERVGFRSITAQDGHIYLNGRPIFLRGLAINPPGRGIPEKLERSRAFAEDYIRYLKSIHVNAIRIPDDDTWYDVCDELGMLVFGGNYSGRVNGGGPDGSPTAAVRWYREDKFHLISRHPSLVIYALTNEVAGSGEAGAQWNRFLGAIFEQLHPWDPTRLYIANAGYGFGRVGDIDDLHRYWGWYYQSPFTFLHLRDYPGLTPTGKVQPITFTECVGNYNGPDGRVNLTPNHKNPLSQLNWTGHAPSTEQGALEYAHQSFTVQQATELFRRLRPQNDRLSGVFPFTILFNHWHDIHSFADMDPKPAALQMRTSYQPILLSWELYTPQVYAGTDLRPIAHIVNDSDDGAAIVDAELQYEVRDAAERTVAAGTVRVPAVPYFGTARFSLSIALPASLATGNYVVTGRLVSQGKVLSRNRVPLFIAAPGFADSGREPTASVQLFDPVGPTRAAFDRLHLPYSLLAAGAAPTAGSPVIIGENAAPQVPSKLAAELAALAREGARIVVLRQSHANPGAVAPLLPVAVKMPTTSTDDPLYPPPPRPSCDSFNINPERPDHPVFAGINRRQLEEWSDYTGWSEDKKGWPEIYPVTDGFVLAQNDDVRTTAILADYSAGLEGVALAEFFTGRGSVLFTGFDLAPRAGLDPIADRLLENLVTYACATGGHEAHPLIDAPIEWGTYETEKGVLTGITSGLMLNSRPALTGSYRSLPIRVTKEGHEFAGGRGGWNSRPGLVYVPFGRRPFGPYVHAGWSGVPAPLNPDSSTGSGRFWCRIPAGRTKAVHHIFNPAGEELTVHITENGRKVTRQIAGGATAIVDVPLDPGTTNVETTIEGDRRLVILETAFE